MTIGLIALLAGLFAIPAALLTVGHRLRRRSARMQSVFWGALLAHVIAALAVVVFSMIPAEQWQSSDYLRGAISFWSLLIAPIVGAALGAAVGAPRRNFSA